MPCLPASVCLRGVVCRSAAAPATDHVSLREISGINQWGYASKVRLEVFGEDGDQAGWYKTAFIQIADAKLMHPEGYPIDLATPNPAPGIDYALITDHRNVRRLNS